MPKRRNNYYEKNKFDCCEKRLKLYLPKSISNVKESLGDNYDNLIKNSKK